jgi:hypothetical protein
MVAPYVDEEVSWAIEKHEALRYFRTSRRDTAIRRLTSTTSARTTARLTTSAASTTRRAKPWYMTSRLVTINDIYSFDPDAAVDYDEFEDVVGRNFRQPREGLGFDGSPVAHMWRTMIWPNNFL